MFLASVILLLVVSIVYAAFRIPNQVKLNKLKHS